MDAGTTRWKTDRQEMPLIEGHTPPPGKGFANKQENLNLFQPLQINRLLRWL